MLPMTRTALLCLLSLSLPVFAQNDTAGNDTPSDHPILKPEVQWHFGGQELRGTWLGTAKAGEAGPRMPSYPAFSKENTAAAFLGDGKKLALEVKDSEDLRFGLNDTITLEAWVKVRSLKDGDAPYVIGKGRLGTKEFGNESKLRHAPEGRERPGAGGILVRKRPRARNERRLASLVVEGWFPCHQRWLATMWRSATLMASPRASRASLMVVKSTACGTWAGRRDRRTGDGWRLGLYWHRIDPGGDAFAGRLVG